MMRQVQALAMTGDLGGALKLAEELRDTFEEAGERREAAQIGISIGGIYTRLGQLPDAEAALLRALAGLSAVGDRQGVAQTHINLGNTYRQQDRFSEAREQFMLALGLLERSGADRSRRRNNRRPGAVGTTRRAFGRSAAAYGPRPQSSTKASSSSPDAVLAQLEEARVHLDLNLLSEAEALAEPLVTAFSERAMQFERAEALSVLGLARARSGNPAALGDLEEAERSWRELPNPVQAALAQLNLAAFYLHLPASPAEAARKSRRNPETALDYAQEAVETLRREGSPSDLALGLVTQVEAQLRLGQREDAHTTLLGAERLAAELNVPQLTITCRRLLGRSALGRGDAGAAERHFAEAVRTLEDVRASLQIDEFKAAYIGDKLAVYGELVMLLLAQGRTAEAFGYAERAKSRALLDLLARGVEAKPANADPDAARLIAALAAARNTLNAHYLAAERGEGNTNSYGNKTESYNDVLDAERRVVTADPRTRAPDPCCNRRVRYRIR